MRFVEYVEIIAKSSRINAFHTSYDEACSTKVFKLAERTYILNSAPNKIVEIRIQT
jgi:hypothetical protein